jgi:hypothetical protein
MRRGWGALRKFFVGQSGGETKTSVFKIGKAPSPVPRVADNAADARSRAAVRLHGGGVVMRFNLKADGIFVIEIDDAGVIFKNGKHQGLSARGGLQLSSFHQIIDGLLAELNLALECFMAAVPPRLRYRSNSTSVGLQAKFLK